MSTANLLSCSYGTSDMELVGYRVDSDAQFREQVGHLEQRIHIEADALLQCASSQDLTTKMAALQASLVDGQDFIVTGAGSSPAASEYTLAAAACQWGGPWVSFHFEDGATPFSKKLRLKIDAYLILGGGLPYDSFTLAVLIRPDGLQTVTRGGQINGANVPAYFASHTLLAFRQAHPYPNWIITADYEASQDAAQSRVNYRLTAVQLANPLPSAGDGNFAVSGSQTTETERDEQQRKITNIRYDLTLAAGGDAMALLTLIRPHETILHERFSITGISETRLTADFTILEVADPDTTALLNFQQRLEYTRDQLWEEKTYIGADPIVVQRGSTLPRLQQSGEATALKMFFKSPAPVLDGAMIDAPQITFDDSNFLEKVTRWQYSFFGLDEAGDPLDSNWVPPVMSLGRDSQADDYVDGPPSGEAQ